VGAWSGHTQVCVPVSTCMYGLHHAGATAKPIVSLLHLGYQLLLSLSIDELDYVRDLVVSLVKVKDKEGLDSAEIVLLLNKQSRFLLLYVLDVLKDLNLYVHYLLACCPSLSITCSVRSRMTNVNRLLAISRSYLLSNLKLACVILLAYAKGG